LTDSFLKKVPLFAGLPEADLERLCQMAEEVRLRARETLFSEGDAGDRAYVIREGEVEVFKSTGGREALLAVRVPGDVIGEMALLENLPRTASVRSRTESVLLAVRKEHFERLLAASPTAAQTLFYTAMSRWRATEAMLRHNEKMAQLGTLTAGIAHEMNNPAAAVSRGTGQLAASLAQFEEAVRTVAGLPLSPEQVRILKDLRSGVEVPSSRADLSPVGRSDSEQAIEAWLGEHGVTDPWEVAPGLVDLGFDTTRLEELAGRFTPRLLPVVLKFLAAAHAIYSLLYEVRTGAGRISSIVKALKSYSFLDQAPVEEVDVHEGLEDTLVVLRHKLKSHVRVNRQYGADVPRIQAYGSELNQVWTNIVDNAADALEGRGGEITIRTRREGEGVAVEIEDNGPGIPPENQARVFDAFFTTKPPGKGTGLGLNISYNIVVHRHRGALTVSSQPGKTVFTTWLPLNPDTAR
jgi:signal transduction histidine kinase